MHTAATRWSTHLVEKAEQRVLKSDQMNKGAVNPVDNPNADPDPLAFMSRADMQSLCVRIERDINLTCLMQGHYHKDPLFMKVFSHPEVHPHFRIKDQLIWTKNQMGQDIVCIPWKAFIWGRRLIKIILDQAHTTIGHFGQLSTSQYMQRYY